MLLKIMLVFTLVPLLELLILVRLAQYTSFLFTVALVVVTGIVGASLARREGLRVLAQIRSDLDAGRMPADSLLDGAMVLVSGALLVTPGILTDAVGFALLAPFSRRVLRGCLKRKWRTIMASGRVRLYRDMGFGPVRYDPPPGAAPLETDTEEEERETDNERHSG